MRRPSRPSIQIPSRKRRRLAYLEDELNTSFDQADDRQIALRDISPNIDGLDVEHKEVNGQARLTEEEQDDEYDDEDQEGLQNEVNELHADLRALNEPLSYRAGTTSQRRLPRPTGSCSGLGLLPIADRDRDLQYGSNRSFTANDPGIETSRSSDLNPKDVRRRSSYEQEVPPAGRREGRRHPIMHSDPLRRHSHGSSRSVHFEDRQKPHEEEEGLDEGETPVTVRLFQDSEDDGDEDEDDGSYQPDDTEESDKENAPPLGDSDETSVHELDNSDTISTSSSETESSTSATTSSSDLSSSAVSSNPEPDELPSTKQAFMQGNPASSSKSVSSVSSARSKEGSPHLEARERPEEAKNMSPSDSAKGSTQYEQAKVQIHKAPGSGNVKTRRRNERRRNAKRLKKQKEQEQPSLHTGTRDHDHHAQSKEVEIKLSIIKGHLNPDRSQPPSMTHNKRSSTLEAINANVNMQEAQVHQPDESSTLIEVDRSPPAEHVLGLSEGVDEEQDFQHAEKNTVQVPDSIEKLADDAQVPDSFPSSSSPNTIPDAKANGSFPEDEVENSDLSLGSSSRRRKIDIESSQRMLINSLGFRAPKTKEERLELQAKLSPERKPAIKSQPINLHPEPADPEIDPNDESWRDKVHVQAFECCHEGVEYSAPPFPFVQRWDPRQRWDDNRSASRRKQEKRKRNNSNYYDNQYDDSFNDAGRNKSPRRDQYHASSAEPQYISNTLNYDQEMQQNADHSYKNAKSPYEDGVSLERIQSASEEDFPPLPRDPHELPRLTEADCRPNAIIAFKKLEMSSQSSWVPYVAEYRTAKIMELQDGGMIHIAYAKRDQPQLEREFDTETGERIYSKFEMPGYDEEVDRSTASVPFSELIEPVLVRDAEGDNPRLLLHIPDRSPDRSKQAACVHERPDESADASQVALINGSLNNAIDKLQTPSDLQNQNDISQVFRDAGWRSSVGSDIKRQLELSLQTGTAAEHIGNIETLQEPPSPRFHGFASSARLGDAPSSRSHPPDLDLDTNPSTLGERTSLEPRDDQTIEEKTGTSVEYPSLPHENDSSEHFPSERQHRSVSFDADTTLQSPTMAVSPPPLRRQSKARGPSGPAEAQQSSSEMEQRAFTFYNGVGGSDSDDEFPELFSQKFEDRLSQEVQIKRETSHSHDYVSSPRPQRKNKTKPNKAGPKASVSNTTNITTNNNSSGTHGVLNGTPAQRNSNNKRRKDSPQEFDDDDDSFWLAKPSQPAMTQESDVVDLTVMSDPIEHDTPNDADESYQPSSSMPAGSGWVDKGTRKSGRKVGKRIGNQGHSTVHSQTSF